MNSNGFSFYYTYLTCSLAYLLAIYCVLVILLGFLKQNHKILLGGLLMATSKVSLRSIDIYLRCCAKLVNKILLDGTDQLHPDMSSWQCQSRTISKCPFIFLHIGIYRIFAILCLAYVPTSYDELLR